MKKLLKGKKKWLVAIASMLCMSIMLCTSAFATSSSSKYEGYTVTTYNSYNSSTKVASATTSYSYSGLRGKSADIYLSYNGAAAAKRSSSSGVTAQVSTTFTATSTVTLSKSYSHHTVSSGTGGGSWSSNLSLG